ncbi:MAG: VOC family protein [Pirellulales bacterium]
MPQPLQIQHLHHVAIATKRLDESLKFYRDVLGFAELQRPGFDFAGAWLEQGGFQIHLIEHPRKAHDPTGEIDSLANHFAMAVADLDEAERRLQAFGLPYKRKVNAGGYQQIFVEDPDGNTVEVGIYVPGVPQGALS